MPADGKTRVTARRAVRRAVPRPAAITATDVADMSNNQLAELPGLQPP